jgi:hypothetical protein
MFAIGQLAGMKQSVDSGSCKQLRNLVSRDDAQSVGI